MRSSSISTLNHGSICEHLLFVQYKTITNKVCGFTCILSNILKLLQKSKNFWTQIFVILNIHKPFLGLCVWSHTKFGPDRFSCLDVYWIQTDRLVKYTRINMSMWFQVWENDGSRWCSCIGHHVYRRIRLPCRI